MGKKQKNDWWNHTALATLAVLFVASAALMGCEPQGETNMVADEVNYWEQRKGACEQILSSPQAYDDGEVIRCMKVWETYRDIGDLSVDMRSMYAVAFSKAYYKAPDDYTRKIAQSALDRLCIPLHPMGADGKIAEQVPTALQCGGSAAEMAQRKQQEAAGAEPVAQANPLEGLRASVPVKDASKRSAKKAKNANKKGLRSHKKKRYGEAIDYYNDALEHDPFYVFAKYNRACASALIGDDESALEDLKDLYTWDSPRVQQQLLKARTDPDLRTLRDYPLFKQLTGYFRLTVANGAGEHGLPEIQRLTDELTARRYTIAATVENEKPMLKPYIFYKPGFEQYATEFQQIIGGKVGTQVIDWENEPNDVIILWGEPDAAKLFEGNAQAAPIVQGTRAEEEDEGIGEITGAVKDAQGGAEELKGTGEGVGEAVP